MLAPSSPRMLLLWLGQGCQSRCVMCWLPHAVLGARRFMDMALVRSVLERYPGLQEVRLSAHGEPLLHPEIGELLQLVREHGAALSFVSNGALVGNWIDPVATSPGVFGVSCDSPDPATYATIRRGLRLADVEANLRAILQHPQRHPGRVVDLHMVVLRNNREQVAAMARWCKDLGIASLSVRRGYSLPAANAALELQADDPVVAAQLVAARAVGVPVIDLFSPPVPCTPITTEAHCTVPWDSAAVFWDGRVVPCCNSDDTMGFASDDFWSGPLYQALREQLAAGQIDAVAFPGCARCVAAFPARWQAAQAAR